MEADITPTATVPAQPKVEPTTETQSATHAATATGSTRAYRSARRAERLGKPLADVPVKAEAPAPAQDKPVETPTPEPAAAAPAPPVQPEASVSKRQQKVNDDIRVAVDRAMAERDAEIARLRAQIAPRSEAAAPAAAAQPDKGTPEWKRFAGLPDAPKLADFDSIEEHTAALSFFIAKTMFAETKQADAERAWAESTAKTNQGRASRFAERLQQATQTTPDWHAKAPAAVMAATPLSGCTQTPQGLVDPKTGQPATFANVVAEVVFESDAPVRLLLHLADHPDEADRIGRLTPNRWEAQLTLLDERLKDAATAAAQPPAKPPTKVLTAAPATTSVVGARAAEAADPKASAIRTHNTRAYRELRREERRAAMGR